MLTVDITTCTFAWSCNLLSPSAVVVLVVADSCPALTFPFSMDVFPYTSKVAQAWTTGHLYRQTTVESESSDEREDVS
jgi:hypothetical protein